MKNGVKNIQAAAYNAARTVIVKMLTKKTRPLVDMRSWIRYCQEFAVCKKSKSENCHSYDFNFSKSRLIRKNLPLLGFIAFFTSALH